MVIMLGFSSALLQLTITATHSSSSRSNSSSSRGSSSSSSYKSSSRGSSSKPSSSNSSTGASKATTGKSGSTNVANTNHAVANAKPGDTVTRNNGTTVTLTKGDISWAKAHDTTPAITPSSNTGTSQKQNSSNKNSWGSSSGSSGSSSSCANYTESQYQALTQAAIGGDVNAQRELGQILFRNAQQKAKENGSHDSGYNIPIDWSKAIAQNGMSDVCGNAYVPKQVENSLRGQAGALEGDWIINSKSNEPIYLKQSDIDWAKDQLNKKAAAAENPNKNLSTGGATKPVKQEQKNHPANNILETVMEAQVNKELVNCNLNSHFIDKILGFVRRHFNGFRNGNRNNEPGVKETVQNIYSTSPQYFEQRYFSKLYNDDFGKHACAATSLLNEISEQYTKITGIKLSTELAESAMKAAVNAGYIRKSDAWVSNWECAANSMWSITGLPGSFSYNYSNDTNCEVFIVGQDKLKRNQDGKYEFDGYADHFLNSVNSINSKELWDPLNKNIININDINLATKDNLGPYRTLDYIEGTKQ